jgi:hypothetical protein
LKIQLKRSNVLASGVAKEPTAAQMEYGELAVNYNTADPVLFIKDSADGVIRLTNRAPDVLPDPIEGPSFQPDTLDVRYISRFSWDNLPDLPA